MKIMQPNTKEDLQKHIAKLENLLTQEISEADRDVHQKSLEFLRISLVALNAIGKPKTVPTNKIIELRKAGNTQEKIAHQLGISLSTVRRELKANIRVNPS